ncbi:unnamed protein product [Prorocentrum cordatum]|uniref:Inosine/uridine-preferring nucleoside hydrolase domain-containing protein n=1 Tax=Prorocentrum cordatum TaxID=2364126 RepID=A0ABN9SRB6_9DINO|nr:unnamed protein product [Polarella glacialis]
MRSRARRRPRELRGDAGGRLPQQRSAALLVASAGVAGNAWHKSGPGTADRVSLSEDCKKVYIDTDVGIDDNLALISAFAQHRLGKICIIGIGVTDGNIPAWISNYSFPRLLSLFGMEDVYFSTPHVDDSKAGDMGLLFQDTEGKYQPPGGRGCAEHIHGKESMCGMAEFIALGANVSFPTRDSDGDPGAFLGQRLEAMCGEKDCDVLVIGPLTNVASASKDVLAQRVNRVIWMGGSFVVPGKLSAEQRKGIAYAPLQNGDWNVGLRRRGNIAPLSEFNAWAGSVPLAEFLTERPSSVGFDMIPLDVTTELMWSPQLVNKFEKSAGIHDDGTWNSNKFRKQLMKFRKENPGVNEKNNQALGEEINKAFEAEVAIRRESNFTYPRTPEGRANFIVDISTKGWASTVADGQIPKKAVANLAHDAAVLAYELNSDLFEAGQDINITVVVKGTATDKLWDRLEKDNFMKVRFKNPQWGVDGAPIKSDLKGALFQQASKMDAQVAEDIAKQGLSKDLETRTGTARIVKFAEIPGAPNGAEVQVMDWLAASLAQAIE